MNSLDKTKEIVIENLDLILEGLTDSIKTKIDELPVHKRQEFIIEFKRKKKSLKTAYILLAFIVGPYLGYLKKWWLQLLHWLTWGGWLIWWIINIFYLPKLVRNYNLNLANKLLNDIDKPYLSLEYIIKIIKDNELDFEQTSKKKILVVINDVKFSIQWKDKDIIWDLVIPIEFYLMVLILFALLSALIVVILSGSFGFIVLGVAPGAILSRFFYRWKPSVFKERRKFIDFLGKNFA